MSEGLKDTLVVVAWLLALALLFTGIGSLVSADDVDIWHEQPGDCLVREHQVKSWPFRSEPKTWTTYCPTKTVQPLR